MYRQLATAVFATLALSAPGLASDPAPEPAPAASAQPAPGQDVAGQDVAGQDVADCLDGACTLTVTGPVDIPLDGLVGVRTVRVGLPSPRLVSFQVEYVTGGVGLSITGAGGTTQFGTPSGTLQLRVLSVDATGAVIELTTST